MTHEKQWILSPPLRYLFQPCSYPGAARSQTCYLGTDTTVAETYRNNFLGTWTKLGAIKKPIIGAVSGYAVGLFSLVGSSGSLKRSIVLRAGVACEPGA